MSDETINEESILGNSIHLPKLNGTSYEKNGWTYISVYGAPRERGFAYGYFAAKLFKQIQRMLNFVVLNDIGKPWEYFIEATRKEFTPKIKKVFPEFYEEIQGIAEGCTANGTPTSADEIITWNNYFTMLDSWFQEGAGPREGGKGAKGAKDRCSSFIAVGDYTKDGKIVCAHNSFDNFVDGQYMNVVLDIQPEKGNRILMQTAACWIWSGTDFGITSAGIIFTETTIGGFIPYENNNPIAFQARKMIQYANNLDDCVEILVDGNSGDYANSWLFGDINTNEIMRLELGLKYHNVEKTSNGFFIGFNAPYDPRIRNLECVNSGFYDLRRHQGARRVRLEDLMDENKGKLDIDLAMKLIADHYDVYLNKENRSSRTVCSHYELDPREYMSDPSRPKPYQPRGAVDGTAIDSNMAANMSFMGRWGSSCGSPFVASEFCNRNRIWKDYEPYLNDRPTQPWTKFMITDHDKMLEYNIKNKKGGKRMHTRTLKPKKVGGTHKTRKNKKIV